MSKKVSRAKRKELRELGELEAPSRALEEARRARRAEEAALGGHVPVTAETLASPPEEDELEESPAPAKAPRRDWTPLVLAGLVAIAGVIFWLTQRPPSKDTKVEVPAAASSAKRQASP